MNIDKNRIPTKLLWVDLEMTGLDPEQHVIIEIGAEVTDFSLKTLSTFEAIITHPEDVLQASNPWAYDQHTKSGLLDRIRKEGRPEQEVVREFASFIQKDFGDEPAILAGNSIHNDRIFIKRWWPEIDELLHYRMLDVSSLKVFMQGRFGVQFEKNDAHRAYDDIQASVAELEYYLNWLQQRPDNQS